MALPRSRTPELCSLSAFIAGSWICIPQAQARLLRAVHCAAASGEAKGGKKNGLKLPISAKLSSYGGFEGLKASPEGPALPTAAEPAYAWSSRRGEQLPEVACGDRARNHDFKLKQGDLG